jgi:hypothetical protein
VSGRSKVALVNRLSSAFKRMNVRVPKEVIEAKASIAQTSMTLLGTGTLDVDSVVVPAD